MKHRTHFEVALELAEGLFHLQQVLVMTQDFRAVALLRLRVGVQEIKAVQAGFVNKELLFALPA